MNNFKTNKISKSEFIKLNENNLMFITNPGRMGDEDGSTFIIKNGKELTIYRVDGWMYQKNADISLDDTLKQFPKWFETWKHSTEIDYNEKYKYLYMGFGNGLSIYNEFEPYLNDLIKKYNDDKNHNYNAIYKTWKKAFINMVNNKGYILK